MGLDAGYTPAQLIRQGILSLSVPCMKSCDKRIRFTMISYIGENTTEPPAFGDGAQRICHKLDGIRTRPDKRTQPVLKADKLPPDSIVGGPAAVTMMPRVVPDLHSQVEDEIDLVGGGKFGLAERRAAHGDEKCRLVSEIGVRRFKIEDHLERAVRVKNGPGVGINQFHLASTPVIESDDQGPPTRRKAPQIAGHIFFHGNSRITGLV